MGLSLSFDPPRPGSDPNDRPKVRRRLALMRDDAVPGDPGDSSLAPEYPECPEHPDRAAADALRRGETSAFELMFTTHAAALHEFVQGYVDADTAHDVVQDVFLTLWRRRESLVFHKGIRAYLFGAARLRALQHRRNARTGAALLGNRPVETAEPSPDPAEAAEVRAAVAHALMTLPGRTRELLALRWVYGLSYSEAAAVLGVSPESAKKLGRRAEIALAPLLDRYRS